MSFSGQLMEQASRLFGKMKFPGDSITSEELVCAAWAVAVGKRIARHARAERLKRQPSRLRINAFLSGRFVDDLEGVRFGHAAVMVEGGRGSVRGKAAALRDAGVFVAEAFEDILAGLEP